LAKQKTVQGLGLRLAAVAKLRSVLGGENLVPLTAGEVPDARDRALANRLVTTALRRHGQLTVAIGELLDKGFFIARFRRR
jgi:16S rRNA (cytosine967-C5)-methyltransferase